MFKVNGFLTLSKLISVFFIGLFSVACNNVRPEQVISPDYIVENINIENKVFYNRAFVPVVIESKKYHFLLDTGASSTVVSSSLDLKKENILGQEMVGSVVDPVFSKIYHLENATIGSLKIPETPTYIMDFNTTILGGKKREQYKGIVGVSSLKNYILYLDVKAEQLYFLNQLPFENDNLGQVYDVAFNEYGLPTINVDIFAGIEEQMLIDTGAVFSSLRPNTFSRMVKKSNARVVDTSIEGASGTYSTKLTWLDTVYMAGYQHKDVAITRSSTSLLGMDILSEYIMMLDFKNSKLYLKTRSQ